MTFYYSHKVVNGSSLSDSKILHYSQKNLIPISLPSTFLFSSPWQSLIYFLSLWFTYSGISYKWDHTVCVLLCLASFTQHVFTVDLCCTMYQNFIPFHGQMISHCIDIPHFVFSLINCFHQLAIFYKAAMNMYKFLCG